MQIFASNKGEKKGSSLEHIGSPFSLQKALQEDAPILPGLVVPFIPSGFPVLSLSLAHETNDCKPFTKPTEALTIWLHHTIDLFFL